MNLIREKRKLIFSNKRITPEIIRNLALIFEKESAIYKDQNYQGCFLIFAVDAIDNSSYESQSIEIFKDNIILEKKVLQKINMRFNAFDFSKNIELQILHIEKDENKENYILVSGEDSNWVNGVITRLSEAIETAEPQPKIAYKLIVVSWTLLILFNMLYFWGIGGYLTKHKDSQGTLLAILKITMVFGFPIVTLYIGQRAENLIKKILPSIELQTGPHHSQIEKNKRRRIASIFLIIIIPTVLAAFYDLTKYFLFDQKEDQKTKIITK